VTGRGALACTTVTPGHRRDKVDERPLTEPARTRLPTDHPARASILAAHAAALAAGSPGYPDPVSGLFVLTAGFLADRGHCCERGCRHCPYVSDETSE